MVSVYKFKIPHETADLVKNLHPELKSRVKMALQAISSDPYTGKALKDELNGLRSFKVRRFGLIYRISQKEMIEITAIGPRKNIYEETFKLISKEKHYV